MPTEREELNNVGSVQAMEYYATMKRKTHRELLYAVTWKDLKDAL